MESRKGCFEKIALGWSKGYSDFPEGAAPQESLITQGTSNGQFFPDNPEDFPRFFRL